MQSAARLEMALARVPWPRVAAWLTVLVAGATSARLAFELAKRAAFPWDLLLWSESPFMTDMLKLAHGQSPFGPAADVNSFTYAPGLEYLCYALLAPVGAAFDVRFARTLCILFGAATALLLARLVVGWVSALEGDRRRPLLGVVAFCLAFLVLFRSPTTSSVHPDTLHMLHAFGTLTLCSAALRRQDFRLALAAMFVGGLGVWTKQPAALAAVGAGLALALGHSWGARRLLILFGVGAGVTLGSLALLLVPDQSRFYLLELPLRHGIEWSKLLGLALTDVGQTGHRLVIWLFGLAALGPLALQRDAVHLRAYLIPWLCTGAFDEWASLAPYLKPMGVHNNLTPIDLWWLVAALVGFARLDAVPALVQRPFAVVLPACLTLTVLPIFEWLPYHGGAVAPNQTRIRDVHYAYGNEYDAAVKRDLAAGKRVLIGNGTMTWIRNGVHEPPLDRMVSALEFEKAGLLDRLGTAQRLAERAYDRIYMPAWTAWFDASFYGPAVTQALAANYREVGQLELPAPFQGVVPNDGLMVRVAIFEPVPREVEGASTR